MATNFPATPAETIMTNEGTTLFNVNMMNITKLTASNYLMWSIHIQALLDGYELGGYLDGSITIPSATLIVNGTSIPNPAYNHWKRQDRLLFSSLLGAISTPIQPLLSTAKTSQQIWETLTTTYAKPTRRLQAEEYKQIVEQIEGGDVAPSISEKLFNKEAKLLAAAQSSSTDVPITANAVTQRGQNNRSNLNSNRGLLMEASLTAGAVEKIMNGEVTSERKMTPVLQVTELKLIKAQQDPTKERFKVLLSDGTHLLQGMLGTELNNLVKSGTLQSGSIVRLTHFFGNVIQSRRIVIVMQLDVIKSQSDIIGHPVPGGMEKRLADLALSRILR